MSDLPQIGLVHAGGLGVYEQSAVAQEMIKEAGARPVFIAVNEAGIDLPELSHWGSLHPNKLRLWGEWRSERGLSDEYEFWALSPTQHVHRHINNWAGGSSGLHGLDIALNGLGLRAAIGCGMPLDDRPNQFTRKPWGAHAPFRSGGGTWTDPSVLEILRKRVRIMDGPHPVSGEPAFTTALIGQPTVAWIRSVLGLDVFDHLIFIKP